MRNAEVHFVAAHRVSFTAAGRTKPFCVLAKECGDLFARRFDGSESCEVFEHVVRLSAFVGKLLPCANIFVKAEYVSATVVVGETVQT